MAERDNQELELFTPPVKDFCFDPQRKIFTISAQDEKTLTDATSIYDLSIAGGEFQQKHNTNVEDHMLGLSSFGTLIEFPPLRRWVAGLSEEDRKQATETVVNTIEQVYRELNTNRLVKLPKKIRGGVFGFNTALKKDGSFELSTFGNCACLGKNQQGFIFYPEAYPDLTKISLPIEYSLHNADNSAQELSLYAGAGTIAWLKNASR